MALLTAQAQGVLDPLAACAPGAEDDATEAVVSAVQSPRDVGSAPKAGALLSANGSGAPQSDEALLSAQQREAHLTAFAWQAPHPPVVEAITLLLESLDDSEFSDASDQTTD